MSRPPIPAALVLMAALASAVAAGRAWASDAPAPDAAEAPVPVPEPTPRAVAFYRSGHVLWATGVAWSLLVPAALLATGLSARLRDRVRLVVGRRTLTVPLFVAAYVALTALLRLPLVYYAGFVRPHEYGLSRESLGDWAADELKELGLLMALAVPAVTAMYGLLRRYPRTWWLLTGLLAFPLLLFLATIKPIWVDPLFNRFGPMRDRALEARILALADRAGIDGGRVFEVDRSRQTTTLNAYVTGLLDTKRIVLWDTIVDRLDDDELLAVMGHEMGHYVLNHVVLGLAVSGGLILVGLGFVHVAAGRLARRWSGRFGFDRPSDIASLPLLVLLAHVANLALTPAGFAFSRHLEREADRFALELTRDNRAAARSFVELQRENLGYPRPGPLYRLWRSTHPSLGDRIDFANTYRPWERGEPLRYADRFRDAPAPPGPPGARSGSG